MLNNKGLKKSVIKKRKHTKKNTKVRKSRKKRTSQKNTKKLSRHNKKQKNKKQKNKKKKSVETTLINGGGCGCGASGTTSPFKNYMSDLRNSLSLNNLGGGGYTVSPDNSINGVNPIIKEYDDNNPPILGSAFN